MKIRPRRRRYISESPIAVVAVDKGARFPALREPTEPRAVCQEDGLIAVAVDGRAQQLSLPPFVYDAAEVAAIARGFCSVHGLQEADCEALTAAVVAAGNEQQPAQSFLAAYNEAYESIQLSMNKLVFAFIRLKRPVPEYASLEIERNLIGICD